MAQKTHSFANLNINIGREPKNESTLIKMDIHNDIERTSNICAEIEAVSNTKPTNDEIWMYVEGKNAKDAKDSVDSVMLFGVTDAYATPGNKGCWVRISFQSIRDTVTDNIPKLSDFPLFQKSLAGKSHLILKMWSDCTLESGIELQKTQGIAAVAAFFENLRVTFSFIGDGMTVDSALDYVKEIVPEDFKQLVLSIYTLIDDLDLTLNFKSWKEVPESVL